MKLEELRKEIDSIDATIIEGISRRFDVCRRIGEYKKENSIPVLDSKREREKLNEITAAAPEGLKDYFHVLYSLIFELTKTEQNKLQGNRSEIYERISDTIDNTPKMFPKNASVACQGVEGAYSNAACEKLFSAPDIIYMNSFGGVFNAVDKGLCDYGVLPIENSTAGSVLKVYDLMLSYNFHIVRSTRIKIDHCLNARPGATLEGIKEIVSHEQALSQCTEFIESLGTDIKITALENTAIAAEYVANSKRDDIAAISSHKAGELYGLRCLRSGIQDNSNNHTRFICIAKKPEIYPGANRTSLMLTLPHKPGSLYKLLARLYALDINLVKLESRPIPDRDFEFMFYFDLETLIYSDEFVRLMCDLEECCEEFHYLGSYSEVI